MQFSQKGLILLVVGFMVAASLSVWYVNGTGDVALDQNTGAAKALRPKVPQPPEPPNPNPPPPSSLPEPAGVICSADFTRVDAGDTVHLHGAILWPPGITEINPIVSWVWTGDLGNNPQGTNTNRLTTAYNRGTHTVTITGTTSVASYSDSCMITASGPNASGNMVVNMNVSPNTGSVPPPFVTTVTGTVTSETNNQPITYNFWCDPDGIVARWNQNTRAKTASTTCTFNTPGQKSISVDVGLPNGSWGSNQRMITVGGGGGGGGGSAHASCTSNWSPSPAHAGSTTMYSWNASHDADNVVQGSCSWAPGQTYQLPASGINAHYTFSVPADVPNNSTYSCQITAIGTDNQPVTCQKNITVKNP